MKHCEECEQKFDREAQAQVAPSLGSPVITCLARSKISTKIGIPIEFHLFLTHTIFLSSAYLPSHQISSVKDILISRSSRMWRAICRQLAKRFFRHVPVFHGRVYDRNMLGESNIFPNQQFTTTSANDDF